ncbi:dioxygenase [Novosphingobium sp. AAP83]|uniref:TauD/TfdA dioxygenase family protein n=1 Tax=Novosphingobium sp. AAP83 TaxID=1523425 RepID=UPI0006B8A3B1|nr:TauD/TfdA family dioxygenase [Novosphingobium sp. AAP83]KPF91846.1 dioxygenase [Novosphingobium sp. AAP83]
MTELAQSQLQFEQIKPKIGARILNTKAELLSGALSAGINALLESCGVLVFPQIDFTDEEQIRFTNLLGGNVNEIRGEAMFKVTLDEKINHKIAEYLKGSLFWHIDGTMHSMPIRASMLTAKVLASEGGDTDFANTASAYDALSQERKDAIADLRVVHSLWRSQMYHTPEPSMEQLEDWIEKGEAELPLVCTHKSGRKSLVLGNTAHYVRGLDPKDSYRVLHGLREFATSEPFSYRHKWTLGDTVIWDNRTSLHRATPYDAYSGRMMHRTILNGTEAWEN